MSKNFNLSIYKEYYDQIKAGTKVYEYREITEYYTKKFIVGGYMPGQGPLKAKKYDTVTFYCKGETPMKKKWLGLSLYPKKNPKWYAIHLGDL